MKLLNVFFGITLVMSTCIQAQNNQNTNLNLQRANLAKERIVVKETPIKNNAQLSVNKSNFNNASNEIGQGQYLNFDKKIMSLSVTGEIPVGFPKHQIGQAKEQYIETMLLWAKSNPSKLIHLPGEGQYLNYDEKIKMMSANDQSPHGFPKHKIFQSEGEYKLIMKNWAQNNPDKLKPQYRK